MRFKVKNKTPAINPGTTKTTLAFAWLPLKINEYIIWLEFYKIVKIYKYNKESKKYAWEVSQIYLK